MSVEGAGPAADTAGDPAADTAEHPRAGSGAETAEQPAAAPAAAAPPRSPLRRVAAAVRWRSRRAVRRQRRRYRRVVRRLGRERPYYSRHAAPSDPLPDGPLARPGVRAAVLASERLTLDLGYEWSQQVLRPEDAVTGWSLGEADLVLLEAGPALGWPAGRLDELLAACRRSRTPVVVWATSGDGSPERWSAALDGVQLVMDVDATRLDQWRRRGAQRVLHAPPAVQPRVHNPVLGEHGVDPARPAGICLVDEGAAGPDLTETVRLLRPERLHVWALRDAPAAPDGPLRRSRWGTVPPAGVAALGRRYGVALAPAGQTGGAAWTALELAASGAAVVSVGPGPAAVPGESALERSSPADARETAAALARHAEWRDRVALAQSRAVLGRRTVGQQVAQVLEALDVDGPEPPPPGISAVVPTNRAAELDRVLDNIGRQRHRPLELVLVLHGLLVDESDLRARAKERGVEDLVVVRADQSLTLGACMNLGVAAASGRYVAKMDDDNYYGAHFLSDLALAFGYTDAVVVGKLAHFVHLEASGATLLRFPEAEHTYTRLVQGGAMLMDGGLVRSLGFSDLPRGVDTDFLRRTQARGGRIYSTDRFNFVSYRRSGAHAHTWRLTDAEMLVSGPGRVLFFGSPDEHATV